MSSRSPSNRCPRRSLRVLALVVLAAAVGGCLGCTSAGPCGSAGCPTNLSCDTVDGVCKCGGVACTADERCDEQARCVLDLPSLCTAGTSWQPGAGIAVFREETVEWGLTDLNPEGVRIAVGDFDHDGWPDVYVRRAGSQADTFAAGGARATWLLHNEQGTGFTDVTEASGITTPRQGADPSQGRPVEVVAFADVNNDGFLDAFTGFTHDGTVTPTTLETAEIMLGDGTGRFTLGPADSPLRREGERWAWSGAAFTDVDRDGVIDLWLGSNTVDGDATQDELFRGSGDGRFASVTSAAGLTLEPWNEFASLNQGLAFGVAWSALACDLNGDGVPELLTASYGRAPNHLWLGSLDASQGPRFTNVSVSSGYAYDERVDWTDNESARCYCKLHPTAADCAAVPPPRYIVCNTDADAFRWNHGTDRELFRLGGNSGTTVCADINNDGRMDLLTTEIRHWDVGSSSDPSEILYNSGDPAVTFTRPGNDATGLLRVHTSVGWDDGDMTAAVFDFDNDGRPDIYIGSSDYPGTRGHLYWQKGDGTFVEVSITEGIDHRSSHGLGVADYDRDGALDIIVGHSRARCGSPGADHCYPTANVRLFRNVLAQGGNWFQLRLEGGAGVNRAAIGARVTVTAGGVTQTQEVGGGHGHYGIQHDLTLHFGLGAACTAEVTVRWPDAALTTQTFTVQTGYRYGLVTGGRPSVLR